MIPVQLKGGDYFIISIGKGSTWNPESPELITYSIPEGKVTASIYIPIWDSEDSEKKFIHDNEIVGQISTILKDEKVCRGLVFQSRIRKFKNYNHKNLDKIGLFNALIEMKFSKATDSFLSYLQSINLDLTQEYLLIKKL